MANRYRNRGVAMVVGSAAMLLLAACPAGDPPPTGPTGSGLSISSPYAGQALAGTVMVAASGVDGAATDLVFELGSLRVEAASDGTAIINTRVVEDGPTVLVATASVGGASERTEIAVVVTNDLPSSGVVGQQGGALRTAAGSYLGIPPGALSDAVAVSVTDTTQESILDEFGVDYPALGVTFLGALTVEADASGFEVPIQADLAGWAEAVQPDQQVVMFALAPDASGNGVGELMFAAAAQATPDGSVVSRPTPRSEVHGVGGAGVARLQATANARPGAIVTIVGRGYNPSGVLSTVARFAGGVDLLAFATIVGDESFNPLMEVSFALPAMSSTTQSVRLHNLTTGHRSNPIDVAIASLGSGTAAVYLGFVDQVRAAVERTTVGRADLASLGATWVNALAAESSSVAAAMAANSGLVSAANRALLDGSSGSGSVSEVRALIARHALVLDAIAVSVPELGEVAVDLATLLVATAPRPNGTAGSSRLQTGGNPDCWSAPQSVRISLGDAGSATTGMGSAAPTPCLGGGAVGGGGPSASAGAYTASRRGVALGPVQGAIVSILRQGTSDRLTPFTALTDESGYFFLPFVPAGEPFTLHAVDPATGAVATADGIMGGDNELFVQDVVFASDSDGAGLPVASFVVTDLGDATFRFDASASYDPDGVIVSYLWEFGDGAIDTTSSSVIDHEYRVSGTHPVRLVVVDDDGNAAQALAEIAIAPSYDIALVRDHSVMPVLDGDGARTALIAYSDASFEQYSGLLVREAATGVDSRADAAVDGTASDADWVRGHRVSADGRFVAFETLASNLSDAVGTNARSVYIKDLVTGAVEAITREDVEQLAGCVRMPDLGADGRHVSFNYDSACGTSSFSTQRVYVKDLDSGDVTLVSGAGFGRFAVNAVNADGTVVAFGGDDSDLVPGDTNGFPDVFVWDAATDTYVRASLAYDGAQADAAVFHGPGSLTSDGRYLLMTSWATNLVPGDTNGFGDAFVRDLHEGTIERVSLSSSGEQLDAATVAAQISADGRYLAFVTRATNVIPGFATGGLSRLFVRDLATGQVAWLDRTDLGKDADGEPRDAPSISGDGRYVAFVSRGRLVADAHPESLGLYRVENPLWTP